MGLFFVMMQVFYVVGIVFVGCMDKKDIVFFVIFGEGFFNQGDFYEGVNFVVVYKLLVIFMCENNKYVIFVLYDRQVVCENIFDWVVGYGMLGVIVDGNDLLEVYQVVKEVCEWVFKGEGFILIEMVFYCLMLYFSDDDDSSYRECKEVEEVKK